jgi:hypothetical protein
MSHSSLLGAIEWEAESGWGEDITTFATDRPAVLGRVDMSGIMHEKVEPDRVVQYRNDGTAHIPSVMGGSFRTKMHLQGHGSTTAGAVSDTTFETLLGLVFGSLDQSAASGTTLTGGTASVPTTTASGTFAAGSLCRVGALGDGDGSGQFHAIGTHVTTTLTLLTAMDGAPVNGAVLYAPRQIFPIEDPTNSTVASFRMRLLSANLRFELHGVFPRSVSFSGLNTGEIPTIEIEWGVSWWRYTTATFPSAVTQLVHTPAPVAAGSFFLNAVGTVTRSLRNIRDFSMDYTLGIEPVMGPGGVGQYQAIVGARRTPDRIKIGWSEDADAATTTPVLDGFWTSALKRHVLYTLSAADGSSVAFYMPQVCITGARPTQVDLNNLNRVRIEGMAYTGPTTTSNLTLSAWRMGLG